MLGTLITLLALAHAQDPAAPTHPALSEDLPAAPALPAAPPSAHIINGERGSADDYPMTGGLLLEATVTAGGLFGGGGGPTRIRQFACSSTLIAPDVVLLAAHCVDPEVLAQGGTVEDLEFRWSRKSDLRSPATPFEAWPNDAIKATGVAVPDEWSINAMQDFELDDPKHDIALLFLEEEVLDVAPAVLPTPEEAAAIQTGALVDVVGWGLTEPVSLLESLFPDPDAAGRKFVGTSAVGEVGDWEFQVGQLDSDVRKCKGDSGGPTFLDVGGPWADTVRLVGVTSRSADFTLCAEKGGFDTRVDAYLPWINRVMKRACADGLRTACDEPGILPPPELPAACNGAPLRALAPWSLLLPLLGLRRRRR